MIFMMSAPVLQTAIAYLIHGHTYEIAMSILPIGFFAAIVLVFFMREPSIKNAH
jgi:hypothetical protein